MTARHRAEEFRRFLNLIDAAVPDAPRRARRARQLLDPQDPVDPALARAPPTVHAALHADLQLVAEPRRALVRRAHHQMAATRHPPLGPTNSSPRSAPGSPTGTTTQSPSSGTRPPTRSSTASPTTANESPTQVTRGVGAPSARARPRGRPLAAARSGRRRRAERAALEFVEKVSRRCVAPVPAQCCPVPGEALPCAALLRDLHETPRRTRAPSQARRRRSPQR